LKTLIKQITNNGKEMKKIIIFGLYKVKVSQLETLMLNDQELNAAVNYEAWAMHGGH
jgi:hypothetical protein